MNAQQKTPQRQWGEVAVALRVGRRRACILIVEELIALAQLAAKRYQGNSKLGTGDVETAVVRGMLLAYDTEKRLQQEGLTKTV